MGKHEDKAFMKRFGAVIAALVGVTIVIMIIASTYEAPSSPADNPSRYEAVSERIQPVGAVRTEMPAAENLVQTAEPESAAPAAAPDGAQVYAAVCQACHATGAAGAPIPGSDAWKERAAKGADTLYASAVNGLNAMPAKGGRVDLSDADIMAAVDHMLAQ